MERVFLRIWSGWIPSSSSKGSSASKVVAPPMGPPYRVAGEGDAVVTDPISKDMKGMLGFVARDGWNGAEGTRRFWMLTTDGFPPEGKTTGGTANSLVIEFNLRKTRVSEILEDILGAINQEI